MRGGGLSVPATLAESVARHPDLTVTIADRRGRDWRTRRHDEVLAGARAAAARYAGLGVGEGDRVVVSLPTSWEFVDAWLGALLAGALPVATASGLALGSAVAQQRRLEEAVRRVDAGRLVCSPPMARRLREAGGRAAAVALSPAAPRPAPTRRPRRFCSSPAGPRGANGR